MADGAIDERLYRSLRAVAFTLGALFAAWSLYDYLATRDPHSATYAAAERHFEDGRYAQALDTFRELSQQLPEAAAPVRGAARSLLQLGELEAALAAYDRAIALEPEFAAAYANRGVLHDRAGRYRAAIADYERAAQLDARTDEGPGWLTRFLRNETRPPPTIGQRAAYLRAELAKPPQERLLRVPEIDDRQRSYQP